MSFRWIVSVCSLVACMLLAGCGRIRFDTFDAPIDASVDAPDVGVTCAPPYLQLATGCYRFVLDGSTTAKWLDVEDACEADGPGTHLAVVDDEIELNVLIDKLRVLSTIDAAIGFSDRTLEGTYRTVTGGAAFLRWAPANPDGGNDCGSLAAGVNDNGMKDSTCEANFNDYICELDGNAPDPMAF
jgi:hypothetical protein